MKALQLLSEIAMVELACRLERTQESDAEAAIEIIQGFGALHPEPPAC